MRATIGKAPTLDREVFDGLRQEFGTRVLVGLVALFYDRAALVEGILRASRGSDGAQLAHVAHRLRGGASILAATRLAELCEELEARGHRGDLYGSQVLAREIATEFERAQAEMSEALGGARLSA